MIAGLALASTAHAQPTAESTRGMVVSVSPEASDAGLAMLRAGGSAVDAAVAAAMALAVTFPEAGNLGGGGFMMVLPSQGEDPICIEYRETAPAAATVDMYADGDSSYGHRVVGVPGTVAGMALAHSKYGKLPWREVLAPAIRLADDGFEVRDYLAAALNRLLAAHPEFAELRRTYGRADDKPWQAGDRLRPPDLANTLRILADDGPAAFYRGVIAEKIVAEMQAGGGLITADDLAAYKARVRKPIHGTYRGYDIYGPPPPSSGGTVVVEALNILEHFSLKKHGRWSPTMLHLMAEASRRAYCDRARFIGDPDFATVPAYLVSKQYAAKLASKIDLERATPSASLAGDIELADEGPSTTHFSVVDGDGMAVANTYTLQDSYGSRVVVRGAGFLLNNEMTDFNWRPGHTDRAGAIGTAANTIAPGKRMLSSQSPTIVLRDGRLVLVTGSPGGRTIPNTVLDVVLNVVEFGMNARQAVDQPRMHHQWFPDRSQLERAAAEAHADLVPALEAMGHVVELVDRQGDAHSILVDDGTLYGAADTRRTPGKAAGY